MFEKYTQGDALFSAMDKAVGTRFFPAIDDRAAWAAVDAFWKRSAIDMADSYEREGYPVILASQYLEYHRGGNRRVHESPYFLRRAKMASAFVKTCLLDDMAALEDAADGLWLICEETSWAISAHFSYGDAFEGLMLPDPDNPLIDLFSAQTGAALSLMCHIAGDRLDSIAPELRERARREVFARLLDPFMRRDDFWWMGRVQKNLNNWTPWVVSNIMICAVAWVTQKRRLAEIFRRCLVMLDRYVAGLPEDGGCDEGVVYWTVAGGALLDALDILERVTGGRVAFWTDEKIRAILSYPLRAWIGGEYFVNYADCSGKPRLNGERLTFAGEKIGSDALMGLGAACAMDAMGAMTGNVHMWRLLTAMFHPLRGAEAGKPAGDEYVKSLEMRILRRNGATLVCKGGTNNDSHNHNDVGSFMVYVDGEPQIMDVGSMTYTRQTFSAERYTACWNTRSMYHNVPLIAGCEQQAGPEYRARDTRCQENGLETDIAPAYPEAAGVERALRRFDIAPSGEITLTDELSLRAAAPVEWVFMLRSKPEIEGGAVRTGRIVITPDRPLTAVVEDIPVTDPVIAGAFPGTIYRLRFIAPPMKEGSVTFSIRPAGNK